MTRNFEGAKPKVDALLGRARGMLLTQGQLTEEGYELVFQQGSARTIIRLKPTVYADGKVIVDAINDFTIEVELQTYRLSVTASGEPTMALVSEETVELPYSTWFREENFL
jgi:hypothetical protein